MTPNPRRLNGHRRNKVRAQVLSEETHCYRCGQPVDVTLPAGFPDSPECDEVVPVALGGNPYDRANCRLSHRLCNQRAGAALSRHKPRIAPYRTARTWTP